MSQTERYQELWRQFSNEHNHAPASAREVADWAVQEGLLDLPTVDPRDILASQISRALREEYGTDEKGRRYRKNHAVRVMKHGVQYTMWGQLDYSGPTHMEGAFQQRREQIIGDCHQLKIDVDVYNEKNPYEKPFQLILNFTDDVAEREVQYA